MKAPANGTTVERSATVISNMFKALSHPQRLRALQKIADEEPHGVTANEVMRHIGVAQSTTSQHLSVMLDAGLIVAKPSGTARMYHISRTTLDALAEAIGQHGTSKSS